MKKSPLLMASLVAVAAFSLAVVPRAFADDEGSNGSNWGGATAFFAQIEPGTQGDHARDQEEPRDGLGNLKNSFGGDWCGFLDFLDGFDDDAVLTCEEQAE